ncbi:MAG TPA: sugar phosphate nucleotidyltransferase [Burkholderiales bacterium]|nr:sugar phosphate nucleotidyltransferase [Burkholderiales bacterium]
MKILAIVLAGGEGTRLHPLTADHPKPAVPFVDGYRIIDFVLSNLVNSGIAPVYVVGQYKPEPLVRHIATAWSRWSRDPERSIRVVLPGEAGAATRFKGTADAVYQNLHLIRQQRPDLVAVFAADHVYRMDVRQMVEFHRTRNADVTVAAVPVPIHAASSFGVLRTDAEDRIVQFQEKPAQPAPAVHDATQAQVSMGNYLFDPDVLIGLLEAAVEQGLVDFGRDVMPALPNCCRVFAYNFTRNEVPGIKPYEERAYWRDVGTIESLAAARNDVIGPRPRFDLWNQRWPIHGEGRSELFRTLADWNTRSIGPTAGPRLARGGGTARHSAGPAPSN